MRHVGLDRVDRYKAALRQLGVSQPAREVGKDLQLPVGQRVDQLGPEGRRSGLPRPLEDNLSETGMVTRLRDELHYSRTSADEYIDQRVMLTDGHRFGQLR